MKKRDTPCLQCPVGESDCEFLQELSELRRRNRELSELVRTDTLTGVFNFRFFMQALEQEMERTRRSGISTCLIMLDLDHFKRVNDTWGHEVGNDALQQAADAIRRAVRRLDIPCRYGGEEFAVILPSTALLVGVQVAERLRRIIAERPLLCGGQPIDISASLGVEAFHAGQQDSAEAFVKRTDELLYRAKQAGRNRVCHATASGLDTAASVSREEKDALFGLFDKPP